MKVLVVGGAGYIGGAVTDLLQQSQHEARVFDTLLYEDEYRKQINFVYGDIRDRERLKPHLDWADSVIWLAALVGDPACALNPDVSIAINQEPVNWLAKYFKGRIIFTSTCSVYGARDGILDESSPVGPLSVYASTKLEAEHYLANSNALIFRLGTLFGVSDLFSRIRFDLAVNTLTVRAFKTGKIEVFGGDQYRPLLHVRDTARAIVDNLTTAHMGIFNLHKQNIRISDLADEVHKHFPDLSIEKTEMKFQDTRNYRVSSEKAKKVLGFNPIRTVDEGIKEVKLLLEEGRIRDVDNPRYTNQKFLSMFNRHIGG